MKCSDCARYKTKECHANPRGDDWDIAESYSCFINKKLIEWPYDKVKAYWADETFDRSLLNHYISVFEQHREELNEVWNHTNRQERSQLLTGFFMELDKEWPIESQEIKLPDIAKEASKRVTLSICSAYLAGYMVGKGWIAQQEASDNSLFLGDELARYIRSILKGAESKGMAFATAFVIAQASGTIAAHLK